MSGVSDGRISGGVGPDMVNYPPHYTRGGVECIDAIEAALGPEGFRTYLRGTVIKYLWRSELKGARRQDLEKARWYLTRLIDRTAASPDADREG